MRRCIRIGSRESRLAVVQTRLVADYIQEALPEAEVCLVTMKTTGDRILDRPLEAVGGKGLFVKELDRALLEGRTELSVHSLKDLPMDLPAELPILGYSRREDPRDVLVLPAGSDQWDRSKPLGCSSKRRILQLQRLYPEVRASLIRGNVQTRLRKLDEGRYGAIVLAAAGLKRLGLEDRISRYFSPEEMLPAAGQGILAVQGRAGVDYGYLHGFFDPAAGTCAQAFNGNFENVYTCILALILFTIPSLIERRLHIDLPDTLEIIILFFIYAAEILGEIQEYYVIIPFWDDILHTLNGFLFAAVGFSLVNILNRDKRVMLRLSPFYMAVMAFCFSMTIGVLWEFFEWGVDSLMAKDMQKDTIVQAIHSVTLHPEGRNIPVHVKDIADVILVHSDGSQTPLGVGGYLDIGLIDTMSDLLVNFIGAVVFSVIGFFYVKSQGKGKLARQFIPQLMDKQQEPEKQEEL